MKVLQFIKSLNNTELGKGGTHETYVLVSKYVKDIEKLFDISNHKPVMINLKNGGVLDTVHITSGREFRINGLGDFYRENNANAGDEIIFERRNNIFYVNILTKENSIIFQKNSKGFEILNLDRLKKSSYNNVIFNNKIGELEITYKSSDKKRSDSPSKTDFYSLKFNGLELLNKIKNNEYFELAISQNKSVLKKNLVWQFYEFNIH